MWEACRQLERKVANMKVEGYNPSAQGDTPSEWKVRIKSWQDKQVDGGRLYRTLGPVSRWLTGNPIARAAIQLCHYLRQLHNTDTL